MSAGHAQARRSTAARPDLRVVRRRSRRLIERQRSRRLAPVVIVSAICCVALIFGVLLEQVVLAQSAFKLARVSDRLERAESTHQELLVQATRLASPGRIERYARTTLGMVDPTATAYISAPVRLSSGRRLASLGRFHTGLVAGDRATAAGAATGDIP
jgi:cell division protein FtsB